MKSGRGPRLGRARPARLGATAARRRIAVLLSRRVRQRAGRGEDVVRAQVGWGVSGAAPRGSRAARPRQRRSEPSARVPARSGRGGSARAREKGERKGVEREKRKSAV